MCLLHPRHLLFFLNIALSLRQSTRAVFSLFSLYDTKAARKKKRKKKSTPNGCNCLVLYSKTYSPHPMHPHQVVLLRDWAAWGKRAKFTSVRYHGNLPAQLLILCSKRGVKAKIKSIKSKIKSIDQVLDGFPVSTGSP